MADVVLDANIIVGSLDEHDSLHVRATALVNRLIDEGHGTVLVDFLVAEAISVICRRANERKTNPPDLAKALGRIREWRAADEIEYQGQHFERLLGVVLDIIEETGGKVGANDAFLVALQREETIGDVASFDGALDAAKGFRRISA